MSSTDHAAGVDAPAGSYYRSAYVTACGLGFGTAMRGTLSERSAAR